MRTLIIYGPVFGGQVADVLAGSMSPVALTDIATARSQCHSSSCIVTSGRLIVDIYWMKLSTWTLCRMTIYGNAAIRSHTAGNRSRISERICSSSRVVGSPLVRIG